METSGKNTPCGGRAGTWLRPLLAMVCAALCLCFGLTVKPRLYPVDLGQYETMMRECGLAWTQEDLEKGGLQYERPVTEFEKTHFSPTKLLTPDSGRSLSYAVAAARLLPGRVTADRIALVLAALLVLSVGLTTRALCRLCERVWFLPALILCAIFTDGSFCAMLRGLYPQGSAVCFLLLYAAVALLTAAAAPERRWALLPPLCIVTVLSLKAMSAMLVFLIPMLAMDLALAIPAWRNLRRPALVFLCLLMLIPGCVSAVYTAAEDPDLVSPAARYESVFHTLLPAAEDPAALLQELGLDESYAADIGRGYYEPEEAYAHNPRSENTAAELSAALTAGRVFRLCLRHPALLRAVVRAYPESGTGYNSVLNMSLEDSTVHHGKSTALTLLHALLPHSYPVFALWCGVFALAAAFAGLLRKKLIIALCGVFSLGGALLLPLTAAFNGYALATQMSLFQCFLRDLLLIAALTGGIAALPRVRAWLTRYTAEPYSLRETAAEEGAGAFTAERLLRLAPLTRRSVMLGAAGLSLLLLCLTFLKQAYPGCVNNGDFGRMMAQVDLIWPGDVYFDADSQLRRFLIADYQYRAPFDALKLTPLRPTYSLYWFVSLVRLITEPFGLPFSTLKLAWIMGLVSGLCVTSLAGDLHTLIGKWSAPASLLLCAMVFSESYLTWYNSLYGESCILLGLLMTLTCALHLAAMPRRRSALRLVWQLGLFFSLYILLTAKAQMLVALPGALLLLLLMSWYQRSRRYDLLALNALLTLCLCAVLALGAVRVYQSDRTEQSTSQKHTMWQAFFYGIFMIADDPVGEMAKLGIDTAMAPDIGKFVQFDRPEDYVYAPLSPEAEQGFYSHVSTATILRWYLTHPGKLWVMLDYAAGQTHRLYDEFRIYRGQDYARPDHDPVDGLYFWTGWRTALTPGLLVYYAAFYGALLVFLLRLWLSRRAQPQRKIVGAILFFLMLTGLLQFPLSVLGNGFADNHKQLFCFSLCHDFLLIAVLTEGARMFTARNRALSRRE